MKSNEVIIAFDKVNKSFQEIQGKLLLDSIRFELAQLKDGETVKLSSSKADGDCIPSYEYNDHINIIHKDGTCPVWNNNDCEGEHVYEDAKVDANWNLITLREILECCFNHNSQNKMNTQEFEDLQTIYDHLDPNSDLEKSLAKAIRILKR